MIARLATFADFDPNALDPAAVEALRTTIKNAPGFVAGYHLWNPETGKAVSFTVYESREGLEKAGQALAARNEDERVGADPDEVEYYTEVIEF
jgi:hypothetical protein